MRHREIRRHQQEDREVHRPHWHDSPHHWPDEITPAHFLGYEFKNGRTTYFIGEDGELRVTRGSKVLVEERGTWN